MLYIRCTGSALASERWISLQYVAGVIWMEGKFCRAWSSQYWAVLGPFLVSEVPEAGPITTTLASRDRNSVMSGWRFVSRALLAAVDESPN